MKKDLLSQVDQICGGTHVTQSLREGIAAFALEQARHFMGMNDPGWVDKALSAPDWARNELHLCNEARQACIQRMEEFLAPWCVKLALEESEKDGGELAELKFSMTKRWDYTKELGSNAVMKYVTQARGLEPCMARWCPTQIEKDEISKAYIQTR